MSKSTIFRNLAFLLTNNICIFMYLLKVEVEVETEKFLLTSNLQMNKNINSRGNDKLSCLLHFAIHYYILFNDKTI